MADFDLSDIATVTPLQPQYQSAQLGGFTGANAPNDDSGIDDVATVTPIRKFDYSALDGLEQERTDLAKLWLSAKPDAAKLPEFKAKAEQLGLSLDDLLAKSEDQLSFGEKWADRLYRYSGPIGRAGINSLSSLGLFVTNVGLRGLSYVPGWESLATKADENNRLQDFSEALTDELNRKGTVADVVGETAASVLGNVSQGLWDIGTLAATGGASGAADLTAAAAKAKKLAAAAKTAMYFGARRLEHELTVATDKGLSPEMRMAYASGRGGIDALFTYGFGHWAETLGLSTAAQAVIAGRPAVARLATRTGLEEAFSNMFLEAGQNGAMEAAQIGWGNLIAGESTDDAFGRIAKAAGIGAVTRGVVELPVGLRNFRAAMAKTQEAMPDTVKGTLEAQKAVEEGRHANVPENASPEYKAALDSELQSILDKQNAATKALGEIKIGEESLKDRMAKLSAAKAELDAASAEPSPGKQTNAAIEGEAIRAERDAILARRKKAEADLRDAQSWFDKLSDEDKQRIKDRVSQSVEVDQAKQALNASHENLTRAQNEDNARYRKAMGFDALPDAEQVSTYETYRVAVEKDLPSQAVDISNDILADKRAMDSESQAGLMVRQQQETAKIIDLEGQKAALPEADSDGRTALDILIRQHRANADVVTRALRRGGSEAARTSAMRRWAAIDPNSPAAVRVTGEKTAGRKLSESESDELTRLSIELTTLTENTNSIERPSAKSPQKEITPEEFIQREIKRAKVRKFINTDAPAKKDSTPNPTEISNALDRVLEDIGSFYTSKFRGTPFVKDAVGDVADELRKLANGARQPKVSSSARATAAERLVSLRKKINELDIDSLSKNRGIAVIDKLVPYYASKEAIGKNIRKARGTKEADLTDSEKTEIVALTKRLVNADADLASLDRQRQADVYDDADMARSAIAAKLEERIQNLAPKTFAGKLAGANRSLIGFLTGGDFVPAFRQGVTSLPTVFKNLSRYWKAATDKKQRFVLERELRERELARFGEKAGLATDLASNEFELFSNGIVQKLAGYIHPELANRLPSFQKANSYIVRKVRADIFDKYVNLLGGKEAIEPDTAKRLADFANVTTGFGSLGGLEKSSKTMAAIFTGPHFFSSRLQHMTFIPLFRAAAAGDVAARNLMARQYAKQIIGLGMMGMTAKYFGSIAYGPDSTEFYYDLSDLNFGRLRIGNTFIDITGGLGRPYRYFNSLTDSMRAKAFDRQAKKRPGDAAIGIATSSLAPLPSIPLSVGQAYLADQSADSTAAKYLVPWTITDMYNAFESEGVPKGSAIALLNVFGAGGYTSEKPR